MKLQIGKKEYTFKKISLPPDRLGECDNPTKKNPNICISKDISGQLEFELTIHELLHAIDWTLSENFVSSTAILLSSALRKLGYHKPVRKTGSSTKKRKLAKCSKCRPDPKKKRKKSSR